MSSIPALREIIATYRHSDDSQRVGVARMMFDIVSNHGYKLGFDALAQDDRGQLLAALRRHHGAEEALWLDRIPVYLRTVPAPVTTTRSSRLGLSADANLIGVQYVGDYIANKRASRAGSKNPPVKPPATLTPPRGEGGRFLPRDRKSVV